MENLKKERINNVSKRDFNNMYFHSFRSSNYAKYLYENDLSNNYYFKNDNKKLLIRNELEKQKNDALGYFNSKNKTFNLTDNDYNKILEKYDKQKTYLKYSYLKNKNNKNDNKQITLLDISYSANHSIKYYAELQNLIDYFSYTNNVLRGYIPLFLTITLDGCYRNFLNADFVGFSAKRNDKEIPKELRYKYNLKYAYSINDLVKVLNYQHKKMRDRYFNKYKGIKFDYIKVFEPHKNGVPHLHCIWFIPNDKELINYLKKIFIECCPAPQNKTTKGLDKMQIINGDLMGFQLSVKNSTAYILKYIQKTFRDVKNEKSLNKINAWYIINKVRRFTRSNIITNNDYSFPLRIWRTLGGYFQEHLKINEYFESIDKYYQRPIRLSEFMQSFVNNDTYISYNFNIKKAPIFIDVVIDGLRFFYNKSKIYVTKIFNKSEKIISKHKVKQYQIIPYCDLDLTLYTDECLGGVL